MNLYEFINFSDAITFYAPDDDIAFAVSLYVGGGNSSCERIENGERIEVEDSVPYLFSKIPDEVLKRFESIITSRPKEVMEAAHTFACCKPGERAIFDEFTDNGKDEEKYDKWDDAHRTSMSDCCRFARGIRLKEDGEEGAK